MCVCARVRACVRVCVCVCVCVREREREREKWRSVVGEEEEMKWEMEESVERGVCGKGV